MAAEKMRSEIPGAVTLFQVVLFLQLGVSMTIFILTTIGISFGYSISSYYLLTILQIFLAVPGMIYLGTYGNVFVALYITLQFVTAVCEVFWLIYMFNDDQTVGKKVALLLITALQVTAIVVAVFFRDSHLRLGRKVASEQKAVKEKTKPVPLKDLKKLNTPGFKNPEKDVSTPETVESSRSATESDIQISEKV